MQACLIIIGDEILSGRTKDVHLSWLAAGLNELGIALKEARVIADDEAAIAEAVNDCRKKYDYVFTTGGIGPTHDDITAGAIAKTFGKTLERNREAQAILETHYGAQINDARLRMADMPAGVTLIPNPVSAAPGFIIENVYVLAGVPSVMRAMFDHLKGSLRGGAKMLSRTFSAPVTEGVLAERLGNIQLGCPDVAIGSYPFYRNGKLGVSLVARATDGKKLDGAAEKIRALLLSLTEEVLEGEPG